MRAVLLFSLTSPASQDLFPVNDTIEYVEIAILQSVEKEQKSEIENQHEPARMAGKSHELAPDWQAKRTSLL